jgi:signal transduction histidine kinase
VLEQIPTPDKGMREWLVFKFPITDAAGQRFLAGMGIDVTERRRAEAQVFELQKLAQERARLADIGAITAKIAHDLGNPLSGLSMQAQLVLQRARRDPDQPLGNVVKPVELLVSEVRRLEGLIREFLSFAREQRLDLQQIDLPPFLRQVLDAWRPVANAHRIALQLDDTQSPRQLEADQGKLRRVLDNLVKNAIEAIEPGPGEVKIVASIAAPDRVRISVEDDGCGIADEVQLFRLFETTKSQGSGLGLAVSKQIVLAHGGDLVFSPRRPRGAAFRVELPLHRLPG